MANIIEILNTEKFGDFAIAELPVKDLINEVAKKTALRVGLAELAAGGAIILVGVGVGLITKACLKAKAKKWMKKIQTDENLDEVIDDLQDKIDRFMEDHNFYEDKDEDEEE